MRVWVDIEELARHYEVGRSLERQGKLSAAVREYAAAERLYQGDFYKSGSCKSGCIFGDECFVSHSGAIGRALHHRRREPHP